LLGAASMLVLAAGPQRFPGAEEVFTIADGVGEHSPVDDPETHLLLREEHRAPPEASTPEPLPTVAQVSTGEKPEGSPCAEDQLS